MRYHALEESPKTPLMWFNLVREFVAHIVQRYGLDEIVRWRFEVWNEVIVTQIC